MENKTIQDILERRSCRRFDPERMPTDEQINQILECGKYAANGCGFQNTKMLVVTRRDVRDQISRMNAEIWGKNTDPNIGKPVFDPFYGAPMMIIVLAKAGWRNAPYDGALVMGNLMLAAHALGVDSIWIHRAKEEFETEEGRALLLEAGINPDEWEGIGHCALGFRNHDIPAPRQRKPDFVHWLK